MQTRMKLVGSTALVAAALVMAAPTAFADKHSSLEKRVKALEKAGGQSVTRTKKTVKLVVSGHMNRMVNYTDNGLTSGFTHTTNTFSQTRVRWIGTGKLTDDLTAQTYIEMGNNTANSNAQSLDDRADVNGNALTDRFAELVITSKSLGRIYLGQGSTGSDGTSEVDLSGTGLLSLNGAGTLIGGNEFFLDSANRAAGTAPTVTVASVFSSQDGDTRRNRLRYDTPSFSGFQITASHGNGDRTGVALRFGGALGGVKIKAAVAYTNLGLNADSEHVNGSASVLLPFGLSLTVGGAHEATHGSDLDAEWMYGKIGYKFKGSELGETRLYFDYSNNEDVAAVGDDATYWGAGVVQIIEPLGAELYAGYRSFELDSGTGRAAGLTFDDVDVGTVGMRVSF